jgi:hypothetical protein
LTPPNDIALDFGGVMVPNLECHIWELLSQIEPDDLYKRERLVSTSQAKARFATSWRLVARYR